MTKKRVLISNEIHLINTGYANYGAELLKRLYYTNKYDLAEFATYGKISEVKRNPPPWPVYCNMPDKDDREFQIYKQEESNQFGKWRFERVCLDFKPDVVIDVRDWYMFQYQHISPLRDFFRWLIMPPIDTSPIRDEWLDMANHSDGILTWCDWSRDLIVSETNGKIRPFGVAPFCINDAVFFPPANKKEHKAKFGLLPDTKIVVACMRNQERKLFPNLLRDFKAYLDSSKHQDVYLYLHTSYPDKKSWEIPTLIKEYNLTNKVLCSYICKNCKNWFPALFSDARSVCKHCNHVAAIMPNVIVGMTKEQLRDMYSCMDVLVQYSTCEGFGIPPLEAAACGVPSMVMDYSSTVDFINKIGSTPLTAATFSAKIGDGGWRFLPDQQCLVDRLTSFFNKPCSMRERDGQKTYKLAKEHYNWDKTIKVWEAAIDNCLPPKRHWEEPGIIRPIPDYPTQNLTNKEFVKWLFSNVLHQEDKFYDLLGMEVLRDINYGAVVNKEKVEEVDRKRLYNMFVQIAQNNNHVERCRIGELELSDPDYIHFANGKI